MPALKKISITLVSLAVIIVLLNYGLSWWISKKLPSIIHSEKDFPYNISYKNLDINLLSGSFVIHDAYIAPKDSTATVLQKGVFGQIKSIEVQRFNLWALLREDKIRVKKIILDTPEVVLYPREKKYNTEDDFVKPFKNSVSTGSLAIRNGNFKMMDSTQNFILKAAKIDFDLFSIRVDSNTIEQNIPVRYRDYHFKCDSLFYKVDAFYNITAQNLVSTDTTLSVKDFRLVPKHSRVQFTRLQKKEKDQFAIAVDKIDIPAVEWGFISNKLFVHSPKVILDKVNANIYRSKEPADDFTTKKLYGQLLREMDFDLKIDKLLLKNSLIQYEEQNTFSRPPAKVSFSKFYATVSNVYSKLNKKKLPLTTLDAQCLFMKASPMKIKWIWNSGDLSDSFTIQGRLQNIKSQNINPVSKPLMNVTTKGDIRQIDFVMNGNRNHASGTFAMLYEDLKVDVYKKDGKKKNKLMTAVGNLLVKNDSNDKKKKETIEVERVQHKSVFNFLWRFLQEGLKEILLPGFVTSLIGEPKK